MRPDRPTLATLVLAALACSACASSPAPSSQSSKPAPTDHGRNLLANAGFEAGRTGWTQMGTENWGAFEIVGEPVRSGRSAALLHVVGDVPTQKARVYGVVQEIRPEQMPGGFPDTLSGWYRVGEWSKSDPGTDLYLQVVVIIWGDPRTSRLVRTSDPSLRNYQIRFYLAGLEQPAFTLSNAKLHFVRRGQPERGTWVPFEIPVKALFQELWGVVPADYEFIRILYEARWDNRPPNTPVEAEVVYDDLFFGYGKPEEP